MASLTVTLCPSDGLTPITCQENNDLPAHITGAACWVLNQTKPLGYYCVLGRTVLKLVKFINNMWFVLTEVSTSFCTREMYCLPIGEFGLRYWRETDVEHPNYVTFGLHSTSQIHRTASFPFLHLFPPSKPMYDMIWCCSLV